MSARRGYVLTSATGGGAPDPLTAPTPPAQGPPEPQGTTSVTLTWTHPDAPPSGVTYTLSAIDLSDGSPVTPASGSGLGPYVLPVTDGQQVICTLTATRGSDGQEATSGPYLASVESGAPSAPGWDTVFDLDLTGLSAATLSSGPATQTVTRAAGGATVATVWSHVASNSGSVTTGASGITADGVGASGSVSALIDIATAAGLTLPVDGIAGLAVSLYMTGATDMGTASNAVRAGISATQERFSIGTNNTVQLIASASGQHTRRVASNETFTTWASSQTNPSGAWVVTILILSGEVCWAWYGTTAPSDADLDSLTGAVRCSGTVTADVTDAIDSVRYTALHAGIMGQLAAGTTWTRTVVRRRRLA